MAEFFKTTLQVILAIFLVPAVIGVTHGFHHELLKMGPLYDLFVCGIGTYLVLHVLIFVPVGVHQFGKSGMSGIFKFNEVTAAIMPYVLPFYLTLLVIGYWSAKLFLQVRGLEQYFMFFFGFLLTMQVSLSAHDLKEQNSEGIKSGYFFQLTMVYLWSIFFAALILHLTLKFSFPDFFREFIHVSWKIYTAVWEQLFG